MVGIPHWSPAEQARKGNSYAKRGTNTPHQSSKELLLEADVQYAPINRFKQASMILVTTHPDLAKARMVDPTTVTYGTTRKFGWLCDEGHSNGGSR